ncbi:quinolinate synthase [Paenibacillus thiaminolyticus]|uniref:Quinolinate synthase n=1 Tax=Paenibacillus thiaminolyticus TaxID=49283 RepID=A0A3A3H0N0_PANTH|nr:quinolinate synthase [Paenibacillus thiaminolyticus]RJG24536.1 quinolinate synthase [Paenibacillus thiaminolyticus]
MTKNIRIVPTLLIMLLTGGILFGGWAVYQTKYVQQPVDRVMRQHAAITKYQVDWHSDTLSIQIQADPNADIREVVQKLNTDIAPYAKGKKVQIEYINENSTPSIDKWWSQALFDVAQAMVHQNYSDIPKKLQELKTNQPDLEVVTEMDNQYVYIQLKDKQGSKTMLLPLDGTAMGVWPHEEQTVDPLA